MRTNRTNTNKPLLRYSALATAACAASASEAANIVTEANQAFSVGVDTLWIDVDGGSFQFSNFAGADITITAVNDDLDASVVNPSATFYAISESLSKFTTSDSVGATAPYMFDSNGLIRNISEGETVAVGFRFDVGGSNHFGWAQVTNNETGVTFTLERFGWNDTADTPAHVGPIPEPSAGLLALAGGSLLAFRRRNRKAADAG